MGELNYDYGDPEHIRPFLEQAPLAREGAGDLDLTIRRWDGSPADFQAPPELDELITASGARGRALAMGNYYGEGSTGEGPESPSEGGGSGPTVPPDRAESPLESDSRTTEVGPLIGGTVMLGTNNTVDEGGELR